MKESTKVLYKCIQGRYVKITWTHKIQEKQAEINRREGKRVKNITCFLSVMTTGGALSSIMPFLDSQVLTILTAILALCLSYFTIRYKDGLLEENAKQNKSFAAKMHDLRNRYESLMTEILAERYTDEQIIEKKDILEQLEREYYENAPHTDTKAVKQSEQALKTNKESTTEEDEIDAIVPVELIIH